MPLLPSPEWISAQAKATSQKTTTPSLCTKALAEFIPAVSPRFVYPHWLAAIFRELQRVELALRGEGPPVKLAFSVPPQFGKSTAIHHWLARTIGRFQHLQHAYCSYAADLARTQSRKIRNIATAAAIPIDPSANRLEEWLTPEGGGLVATGVGGPLTGKPISGVGVIDDPTKNREEAESARQRATTWDWYTDTFLSRLHPQASQVIVMTRWHPDDLIGRVTKEGGWTVIALPAITEAGKSLWPEGRPLPFLEERRAAVGEYGWWSMYMQQPRPRGGTLFQPPRTCLLADVPTTGRMSIGIDLAYSAKTRSDYTAIVALVESGEDIYVAHVDRFQLPPHERDARLHSYTQRFPGVRFTWHASGMEGAETGARLQREGLPLSLLTATSDKFVRAQSTSAKWNPLVDEESGAVRRQGRFIVPRDASWSTEYLDEMEAFTGVGDAHDDMVDATVSADEGLSTGTFTGKSTSSKRTHSTRSIRRQHVL